MRAYQGVQASCVGPAADSSEIAPLLRVLSSGLLEPYLDSVVSPARVVSRQPTLLVHQYT